MPLLWGCCFGHFSPPPLSPSGHHWLHGGGIFEPATLCQWSPVAFLRISQIVNSTLPMGGGELNHATCVGLLFWSLSTTTIVPQWAPLAAWWGDF